MISFSTDMKEVTKRNIAVVLLVIIILGAISVRVASSPSEDGKSLLDEIIENLFKEEKSIELGDLADVHYIGRYASNNTIFDSSYGDVDNKTGGTPLNIFVNLNRSETPPEGYEDYSSAVIDGLLEGLIGLKESEVNTIGPIPPGKAYGEKKLKTGNTFSTSNLAMVMNQTVQVTYLTDESISFKWIDIENFGKFTMPQLIISNLSSSDINEMVIYPPPYYLWENSSEIIKFTDETVTVYITPTKSGNITDTFEGVQYGEKAIFIFPDATTAVWNDTTITLTSSPEVGENYTLRQDSQYGPIELIFTVENTTNDTINVSFIYEGEITYQESIRTLEFNRTFIMPRMYNNIPALYMYIFEGDIEKAGYSTHELAGEELIFDVTIEKIYKPS